MKKTKILSVLLAFLACVALLGSCDYWKEDYYKNGGDSGSTASEFTGSYTITFSSGTITVTFNGNSITLTNGSITASGTGTLVVQTSSGSTGGSGVRYPGAGIPDPELHTMTAEEQAVYNSFLGTRYRYPSPDANTTYFFNTDGTVIKQEDNEEPDIYEHWWVERDYNTGLAVPTYNNVFRCYIEDGYNEWGTGDGSHAIYDEDGDGIYDLGAYKRI